MRRWTTTRKTNLCSLAAHPVALLPVVARQAFARQRADRRPLIGGHCSFRVDDLSPQQTSGPWCLEVLRRQLRRSQSLSRVAQWNGFTLALPFLIIATVHGAFLSQQLWGSTYALWPLFMILLAIILSSIAALSAERAWVVLPLTVIIAASMLVAGVFYVVSHERLDYAKLSGKVLYSTLPPLSGTLDRRALDPRVRGIGAVY